MVQKESSRQNHLGVRRSLECPAQNTKHCSYPNPSQQAAKLAIQLNAESETQLELLPRRTRNNTLQFEEHPEE